MGFLKHTLSRSIKLVYINNNIEKKKTGFPKHTLSRSIKLVDYNNNIEFLKKNSNNII